MTGIRTWSISENDQLLLNWKYSQHHHDLFRTIERDFELEKETYDAIKMDPQLEGEIRLREHMHYFMKRTEKKELLVQNFGNVEDNKKRRGFMVLGMHRSGTSMLAGLLVKGLGYHVGPNHALIRPNFDNEKGFFERVDAVLQNDAFMRPQRIDYANNVISYDADKALKMLKEKKIKFGYGTTALKFLNDKSNVPWMQKVRFW